MWLWSTCVLCQQGGPSPCASCVEALRPLAQGELDPPPAGVDGAAALCRYEGLATGLVTSLKFRRHRDAVGAIGSALAIMGGPWIEGATVCWVPAEPSNRAERGFDQSELLAHAAASAASTRLGLRVPAAALLSRSIVEHGSGSRGKDGALVGQTGRSRADRLVGPSIRPTAAAPHRVVVIDDVTTTGASLARAAMALRSAGAREVYALCVAATPDGARPVDAEASPRRRSAPHR